MGEESKSKVSKDNSDYTKQFSFHDEEINKDVDAFYNPKERDSTKAWKRVEKECRCNK